MDAAEITKLTAVEATHWWFAARRDFLRPRLGRPSSTRRALDVGAAGGGNTALLVDLGWTVTAIEHSAAGASVARQRGLPVVRGDVRRLPIHERSQSLVTALDVIEHIDDDEAAAAAMFRVLEPGGRIVVTVPAGPALWSAHDVAQGHFRRYTRQSLTDVVAAAGFEIDTLESWNVLLRPAVRLARSRRREGCESDLQESGPLANRVLGGVLALERRLPPLRRLPGVSLVLTGHRPHRTS